MLFALHFANRKSTALWSLQLTIISNLNESSDILAEVKGRKGEEEVSMVI